MNHLEAQLHYPLGERMPEPAQTLEVAPGIRWVRMALPFALDHINLWLLRDELEGRAGWTVVDCCIDRPESRAQWEGIFEGQLEGLPVLRVIVTHMHPDHIGLAHWLCERWKAPLWMSGMDYYNARVASLSTSGNGGEAAARFFALHGMSDEKALKEIGGRTHYYRNLVPDVPANYRRLMDGMRLRIGSHEWVCIDGFGHAPEHIALYCEALKVLISGDMVLPRISSNVSVYEVEPEGDPLSQFLTSIDRFKPLPVETLVLPSHGRPFNGLHERINQLHTHHQDRLNEVMQACEGQALTAMQVLPVLFKRTLDLHQTTFAMGETIAHVHALWHAGKLQRQQDAQGVYRFMAKAATPRS